MSKRPSRHSSIVSDLELRATLETGLSHYFGKQAIIRQIKRRVSDYCSSYLIEDLDVTLDGGKVLQLVFKDVSHCAIIPNAREVKPAFLHNPLREIESYRDILASHQLGTPVCYGAVAEHEHGRYWLFLERVQPTMLWQTGDFAIWLKAARWLAAMHSRLNGRQVVQAQHLLCYDEKYYWRWLYRAQEFIGANDRTDRKTVAASIDRLAGCYNTVVERLLRLPSSFIHGEFYPSNIMVAQDGDITRICPVDWEMAAMGPGLIDLAALSSGGWSPQNKKALALAYLEALPQSPDAWRDEHTFLADLEFCRLHLAVQLLGWSSNWSPPAEHDRNWLAIAIQIAEELEL